MASMVTNKDKILAMLATIREIHAKLYKNEDICRIIYKMGEISQKDLINRLGMSIRTARRRIANSVSSGKIIQEKRGREVHYRANPHYPQ